MELSFDFSQPVFLTLLKFDYAMDPSFSTVE